MPPMQTKKRTSDTDSDSDMFAGGRTTHHHHRHRTPRGNPERSQQHAKPASSSKRDKFRGDYADEEDDHSENSRRFRDKYDVQVGDLKETPMSDEEYRFKQIDMIIALKQFKEDGIPVDESVELSPSTSLKKLQFAYDYSMRYLVRKAAFEQFRQGLTLGTNVIEIANAFVKEKTGYGAELDGWGKHVMMNMPKFNRPLQRLAEKYGVPTGEQAPEVELALALGYSAFSFHFAKKMSVDPQVAMQFMDFMQDQKQQQPSLPMAAEDGGGVGGSRGGGAQSRPVASPMGMRPPLGKNTRVPMTTPSNDHKQGSADSDVDEVTEEVEV